MNRWNLTRDQAMINAQNITHGLDRAVWVCQRRDTDLYDIEYRDPGKNTVFFGSERLGALSELGIANRDDAINLAERLSSERYTDYYVAMSSDRMTYKSCWHVMRFEPDRMAMPSPWFVWVHIKHGKLIPYKPVYPHYLDLELRGSTNLITESHARAVAIYVSELNNKSYYAMRLKSDHEKWRVISRYPWNSDNEFNTEYDQCVTYNMCCQTNEFFTKEQAVNEAYKLLNPESDRSVFVIPHPNGINWTILSHENQIPANHVFITVNNKSISYHNCTSVAQDAIAEVQHDHAAVEEYQMPKARPSWDELWMRVAEDVRDRATCESRHVGAVIVHENDPVSVGYNGSPKDMPHCADVGCLIEAGRCVRATHAERNAIDQAARAGKSTRGATIYTTHRPCADCANSLPNAGIVRVVFRDGELSDHAKQIFERNRITWTKLE